MERYTVITVDMDTAGIGSAAGGLQRTLQQLQQTTEEAFSGKTVVQYVKTTTGALTKLRNSLSSVKRSLAGFDQLQRLDQPASASKSSSGSSGSASSRKSGTQLLLEYLKGTDVRQEMSMLQAVKSAVEQCNTAVQISLGKKEQLRAALNLENQQLGMNTTAWNINKAARASVTSAQQALIAATGQWNDMCAAAGIATTNLKTALLALETEQTQLCKGFAQVRLGALDVIAAWQTLEFTGEEMCRGLRASVQLLEQSFRSLYSRDMILAMQQGMHSVSALMRAGLDQLLAMVEGGFAPGWRSAWLSVAQGFQSVMGGMPVQLRSVVNSIIRLFNGMLSAIAGSMNALIGSMNQLRLGAGTAGLSVGKLPAVSVPRIPYLAQGAVLPANRPFLAMVGDQKHGTNIEAPLTTIQEAVALVMDDQTAAIMAGFEASVGVQKEILEAVLGIRIGDDVIGQASQRYARKMAVVRGGSL